jgi:hypothetical protein
MNNGPIRAVNRIRMIRTPAAMKNLLSADLLDV